LFLICAALHRKVFFFAWVPPRLCLGGGPRLWHFFAGVWAKPSAEAKPRRNPPLRGAKKSEAAHRNAEAKKNGPRRSLGPPPGLCPGGAKRWGYAPRKAERTEVQKSFYTFFFTEKKKFFLNNKNFYFL
jgi:hypothetical protein